MNHDKMRRASELPLDGPAATDTLAASGGLELPGKAADGLTAAPQGDLDHAGRNVPKTAASVDRLEGGNPDARWRSALGAACEEASPAAGSDSASSPHPARRRDEDPGDVSAARLEPIPGEHDRATAMTSQPGIVGTTGYGGDATPSDDTTLDEELAKQTRWEAGGRFPRRDAK